MVLSGLACRAACRSARPLVANEAVGAVVVGLQGQWRTWSRRSWSSRPGRRPGHPSWAPRRSAGTEWWHWGWLLSSWQARAARPCLRRRRLGAHRCELAVSAPPAESPGLWKVTVPLTGAARHSGALTVSELAPPTVAVCDGGGRRAQVGEEVPRGARSGITAEARVEGCTWRSGWSRTTRSP